jgi:hypothetical protein
MNEDILKKMRMTNSTSAPQMGEQPVEDMEQDSVDQTGLAESLRNIAKQQGSSSALSRTLPQVDSIQQLAEHVNSNEIQEVSPEEMAIPIAPEPQAGEMSGDYNSYINLRKKMMGF